MIRGTGILCDPTGSYWLARECSSFPSAVAADTIGAAGPLKGSKPALRPVRLPSVAWSRQ
jgi:hypothetical protein